MRSSRKGVDILNREKLGREVDRILDLMNETEPHTPEYERLLDRLVAISGVETEQLALIIDDRKNERDNKTKARIEYGVAGAHIGFAAWFMSKGWRFEESGSYVSTTTRWLLNKIKLKWR